MYCILSYGCCAPASLNMYDSLSHVNFVGNDDYEWMKKRFENFEFNLWMKLKTKHWLKKLKSQNFFKFQSRSVNLANKRFINLNFTNDVTVLRIAIEGLLCDVINGCLYILKAVIREKHDRWLKKYSKFSSHLRTFSKLSIEWMTQTF